MRFSITTRAPVETERIGNLLAGLLLAGDVVALTGELGAGKTVLARGIARGMGHDGIVSSPTFTLINEYPEIRLCHVDAYRLADAEQLIGAGFDDYLGGTWILLVEWADRVRPALPGDALWIRIRPGVDEGERQIRFEGNRLWKERLGELVAGQAAYHDGTFGTGTADE